MWKFSDRQKELETQLSRTRVLTLYEGGLNQPRDPQNGLKTLQNFVLNPILLFTDMSNVFALVKSKDTNETRTTKM